MTPDELDEIERYIPIGNPDAFHRPLRQVIASHRAQDELATRIISAEADLTACRAALDAWMVWCTRDSSKAQRDRAYLLTRAALSPAQPRLEKINVPPNTQ